MILPVFFDWLGTVFGLDFTTIKQTIDKPMRFHEKYKTLLTREGINTPLRLAHFIAQLDHESGLKPIEENLRYSAKRLMEVFPKYFKIYRIDTSKDLQEEKKRVNFENLKFAESYAYNPSMIGSRVYANRMGNGNETSQEGYKFRGRGFIQLTGKDNYKALSQYTGTDYVKIPDLLLNEADALIAALWYWNNKRINRYADVDNIRGVTAAINGGYNGLEDRKRLLVKYKKEFNI